MSASICTGKRDALNIWVNLLTAVRQRRSHLEVQLLKTTQQHLHLNSILLPSQLNPTSDVFPDHSKLCLRRHWLLFERIFHFKYDVDFNVCLKE